MVVCLDNRKFKLNFWKILKRNIIAPDVCLIMIVPAVLNGSKSSAMKCLNNIEFLIVTQAIINFVEEAQKLAASHKLLKSIFGRNTLAR